MNNSLADVVSLFLTKERIQFDETALKKHLAAHPYFPSLLSLTQTLSEFGICMTPLYSDWDLLQNCSQQVLLHLKGKQQMLVLLDHITEDSIYYKDGNGDLYQDDKVAFQAKWDGILVVVDSLNQEKQEEIRKQTKEKSIKKVVLTISVMILLGGTLASNIPSGLFFWILFVLKLVGCVVSYFLVKHTLGHSGKMMEKVCHMGKSTDCNAVLTSPAAKLFNRIGMSDIGVVYFSGGLLALLYSAISHTGFSFLVLLSVIAFCSLPYTLFSLYYQRFVVKKWCPFCLAVILILWLEALTGYFIISTIGFKWNLQIWIGTFFLYLFIAMAWSLFLDRYERWVELENIEFEYFRWKKNDWIFYQLWKRESELPEEDRPEAITVGDPEAAICITAVVGLRCKPCSKEYQALYHLLVEVPEEFRVELHMASGSKEEKMYEHLLSLYKEKGSDEFADALKLWYSAFDEADLIRNFPVKNKITKEEMDTYTISHNEWEKKYGIDRTPAVFVNNRSLFDLYKVQDLRYFTDLTL